MPFSPHEFVAGTDKKLLEKLGTYEAELHPRIASLGMGRFLIQHADNRIARRESTIDFYNAFDQIGKELDRLEINPGEHACHLIPGVELNTGVFFIPHGTRRRLPEGAIRIIVNKTKDAPKGNEKIMTTYDYVLDPSKGQANLKWGSLHLSHINPDFRPKAADDAPVGQLTNEGIRVVAHDKYVSPEPKAINNFALGNLTKLSGRMNDLAYLLSTLDEPTKQFMMPRPENQTDNPE